MRHMAFSVWLQHNPERCWFFVYTAYFDASGHAGDPQKGVYMVVGFLSTVERWLGLEEEWNGMLHRYGVPYLHMKEYTASVGPFVDWKTKTHKRAAFLARAAQAMKTAKLECFASGFLLSEYESLYPLYERLPTPYQLAAGAAIISVVDWLKLNAPGEAFQHVFAWGDEGQGPFRQEIENAHFHNLGPITVRPWRDPVSGSYLRPFEPVDFYAWEHRRLFDDYLHGRAGHRRKSLEALDGIPEHNVWIWRKDLITLCDMLHMPHRKS